MPDRQVWCYLSFVLFFTSDLCLGGAGAELSTIQLSQPIKLSGVACTPSGVLIMSCCEHRRIWAVYPATGHCELIAELPPNDSLIRFHWPILWLWKW
jgi:hypothetical protein